MKLAALVALAVLALAAVGPAGAATPEPAPDFVDRYVASHFEPVPDFVQRFIVGHPQQPQPTPDFVDRYIVGHAQQPLDSADRYALGRVVRTPDFVDRYVARTAAESTAVSVGTISSPDDGSPIPLAAFVGSAALLLLGLATASVLRARRRLVARPL
jgi:hypothetical protein